ncbi:MAG: hypothetical protein WCW44_00845 [archaeon]|jgi:hypothetical protein
MPLANDLQKKKESLVEKFVRIVLRKKPAQSKETQQGDTAVTQNKSAKIKQTNAKQTKTLGKKNNLKKRKSIKKTKKPLKTSAKKNQKGRILKKIKKTNKKIPATQPKIKSTSPITIEPPQEIESIQINTLAPSSKSDSTFTELEEEALKTKRENELKAEAKNSVREKEQIEELGKKICLNCKTTDFDRVLSAVQKYGSVEAAKLRKELNIPEKQFAICYTILQKNGEIKLEYPLVGRMKLVAVTKNKTDD